MFKNRVIFGHLGKSLAFVLVLSMLLNLFGAGIVIADPGDPQNTQQEVIELIPTQDTYIDGNNINTNYGSTARLKSKRADTFADTSIIYMDFDISQLRQDIISLKAELRINVYANDYNKKSYLGKTLNIYDFEDIESEWSEGELTYSNSSLASAAGESTLNAYFAAHTEELIPIGSITTNAVDYETNNGQGIWDTYIVDLSSFIATQMAAGKSKITLAFFPNENKTFFDILSRESTGTSIGTTPAADGFDLEKTKPALIITSEYESVPPTGIELDEQTLNMFAGEKRTLTATISPENADSVNIIWSSENENVATVANGVVTAVAAGTTTIRATIEGMELSAECVVNVNELVIAERTVRQDTCIKEGAPNTAYGASKRLEAYIPSGRIIYLEFDISKIKAEDIIKADLRVNVVCTTGDSKMLNIYDFDDIDWSENSLTYNNAPYKKEYFATEPKPVYAGRFTTDKNNVWDAYTADLKDLIKAKRAMGKTKITLGLYPDVGDYFEILSKESDVSTLTESGRTMASGFDQTKLAPRLIVSTANEWTPILPDTIELDKTTLTVAVGRTGTLNAALSSTVAQAEDLEEAELEWISSDTSIATVANGVVTGVNEGTATITARIKGTEISAACEVKVISPKVTTRYPMKDSYIYKAFPEVNYGSVDVLGAHDTSYEPSRRVTYMDFDISGISSNNLEKAELRLNIRCATTSWDMSLGIYDLGDIIWSENELTYNNAPYNDEYFRGSPGTVATIRTKKHDGSLYGGNGAFEAYTVDLTDFIKQKRSLGKNKITIGLYPVVPGNTQLFEILSKESTEETLEGRYIVPGFDKTQTNPVLTLITLGELEPMPTIKIDAPGTLNTADEFDVKITLEEAKDVQALEAAINYDRDRFDFISATAINGTIIDGVEHNSRKGKVNVVLAFTGVDSAISGDKEILTLKFKPKASGEGYISASAKVTGGNGNELDWLDENSVTISITGSDQTQDEQIAYAGEALATVITAAQSLYDNATVGDSVGEYTTEAKAALQSAIISATETKENPSASLKSLQVGKYYLDRATTAFRASVKTASTGDISGNNAFTIGDIGMYAFYYGKNSTDSEWADISSYDMNGDNAISDYELIMVTVRMRNSKPEEPPEPQVPVILEFKASTDKVKLGESFVLSWRVEGATSIQLTTPQYYNYEGLKTLITENSKTIIPNASFDYVLTAKSTLGEVKQTVRVEVEQPDESNELTVFNWPDYLLEDQMEYLDLKMWDYPFQTGGGIIEYDSLIRYSGEYSMKCIMENKEGSKDASLIRTFMDMMSYVPVPYEEMYGRLYLYLGDDFSVASGEKVEIFYAAKTNDYRFSFTDPYGNKGVSIFIKNDGGKLILSGEAANGTVTGDGTTGLEKGKWYKVGFGYNKNEGTVKLYLDGKEEIGFTGLSLNYGMTAVMIGAKYTGSSAQTKGSLYIDDVFVDTKPIDDMPLRLYAPDFRGRIGVKAVVIMSDYEVDDRIVATLTSDEGYSKKVYNKTDLLNGRVEIPVNLRELPSATYTFKVELKSAEGQKKYEVSTSYTKPYDGDPEEYSIDENNNITFNGEKMFPVTSFGLAANKYTEWYNNNYINMTYASTWGLQPGAQAYKDFLDAAVANYPNAKNAGPGGDTGYDRNSSDGRGADAGRWNPKAIREYIDIVGEHQALAWWIWREEPDNWRYASPEVKAWYDLVKLEIPDKLMENLLMGYSYVTRSTGLGWRNIMRNHHWPYLNADIYSWDVYPVENEGVTYKNENYGADIVVGFDLFADIMITSRRWNMDLVPIFPNIQTADVTPGTKGGTPTPTEILNMCWSMVVNGAKGIHWYHYQGVTPPENYAAMAKFVNDTTALKEVILGEELKGEVTMTLSNNGRVDYVTKTDGTDIYIMAVNVKRANETATFDLGNINAVSVEVYGENRTIPVTDGKFSDSFINLTYHIYKLNMADAQPTGVVISGGGVTETPDGRTLSLTAGSETTLSATLLPMNVAGKNTIWWSSNEEVATIDANGKVTVLKEGTAVIKVMVNAAGNEFIDECIITVTPKAELLSIAVTTPPDKTTYYVGEALDLTGLVVTGTYADGTTAELEITADHISGFDSSEPAEAQIVTINYGGQTATFTVNIFEREGYEFVIENPSLSVGAGITAQATITPIIPGGGNAVVIFKLMQGDTVLGLYSGELPIVDSVNLKVKFHGYSGDQYKVKIFVWDELDDSVDSIGVDLALPVEVSQ